MKVVYVLNVFPKISETFILNEIVQVQKKGILTEVYAYKDEKENAAHDQVGQVREVRYFYKVGPLGGLYAHLYWLLRRPLGYLRAWQLVLAHGKFIRKNFAVQLFDTVLLDRRKPDHVHAHYNEHASDLAMIYSRLSGVPFTFTTHMHDIFDTPSPNFKVKSHHAVKQVTISEFNKRYIVEKFKVEPDDIAVIHCGIDLERVQKRAAVPKDPNIFLSARLHRYKGLDVLIEACKILKERGVQFICRVAGEGEERSNLERSLADYQLTREVLLIGNQVQSDVFRYLREARLMALPSRLEGIPVSLMEALAFGVPVISTRITGIPELIEDGVSGFLVEPEDPKALADRMETLLKDDDLCACFAGAGQEKVKRDFDLATETDKLIHLWKTVR